MAVVAVPCQAELIGITLDDFPDIASFFIDVVYDASVPGDNGQLVADGFAIQYDPDGDPVGDPIVNGTFDMFISINKLTGEADSGEITIGGDVNGFGSTLITGVLDDFGFLDGGGNLLDALFTVTGGDLAPDWGGNGQSFGVILNVGGDGYTGDFSLSFDNLINGVPGTGRGISDAAPVGLPGPSALALLACAGLCGRHRRRRII